MTPSAEGGEGQATPSACVPWYVAMADSSALQFCRQDEVNLELSQRVEPESMQGRPGTEAVAHVWASEVLDFSPGEASGLLRDLGPVFGFLWASVPHLLRERAG